MRHFLSILAVATLAVLASVHAGKEHHAIKKWAHMKALESCLGSEALKLKTVKIKTATAKCLGIDAPELDLPMFQSPYGVIGAIVDGAFNYPPPHHHHPHGHPPPPSFRRGGPPARGGAYMGERDWMDEAMKKVFYKKMMQKFLEEEFGSGGEEDTDMMDAIEGIGGGRREAMRYFRKKSGSGRWRRDTEEKPAKPENESKKEQFELGERLNAKLQQAKEQMEAEIGNYTCVLRETGVIDASNNLLGVEEFKSSLEAMPIKDEWLKNELSRDIELCHQFAEAVPQAVLEDCECGPKLGKVKIFKKCMKMHKMRTCMQHDIKRQLETNFGSSLEDLVETTELEENELIALIQKLLATPEVHH